MPPKTNKSCVKPTRTGGTQQDEESTLPPRVNIAEGTLEEGGAEGRDGSSEETVEPAGAAVAAAGSGNAAESRDTSPHRVASTAESGPEKKGKCTDDVIEDTHLEYKKLKWQSDSAANIPKFSLVKENRISVEEWCTRTRKVLNLYQAPPLVMVRALITIVDLPGFNLDYYDMYDETVDTFLEKVAQRWNKYHKKVHAEAMLPKSASETWEAYFQRLRSWCALADFHPSPRWYLSIMRSQVSLAEDVLHGVDVDPLEWACTMDAEYPSLDLVISV